MDPNLVRNRLVTIYLMVSLVAIFWLFQRFIFPILISGLLVLICSDISTRLETVISHYRVLKNWVTIISAGVITLLFVVLIVIPLFALLSYVINKINYQDLSNLKNQLTTWFNHITWINMSIKQKIVVEIQSFISNGSSQSKPAAIVLSSMQKLSSSTLELSMIIVLFFLFLWKRHPIANFLEAINPLPLKMMRQITNEVASTLQIVLFSLLALAIAQGFAFAGLMLFYDYNAPILGFAAGVCSVIPIFGTALVWVPVAISEFIAGNIIGALIIIIFGWLVMAVMIDNFLRIILLKKIAISLQHENSIDEFLLFFAIAAGLSVVGFWGIILGPALVALFLSLYHIYISSKQVTV